MSSAVVEQREDRMLGAWWNTSAWLRYLRGCSYYLFEFS